jgi:hypothetical protein
VLIDERQVNLATTVIRTALELDEAGAKLQYRLGLIYCGELEFDLAMEAMEHVSIQPDDVQRRIWREIDAMMLRPREQSEAAEMKCH